jgi:hypothetical protein
MHKIPIVYQNKNLEILTKLLNSVAKKYGCHVEYVAEDESIRFSGDMECCRHVTEETLALFPKASERDRLPLNCSFGETVTGPNEERHS